MTDDRIQDLYKQVILEHNKAPYNYKVLPDYTHCSEGYNPLCGDHIWIYLQMTDETIDKLSFTGEGCAICKASASIMTMNLQGEKIVSVRERAKGFQELAHGSLAETKLDKSRFGKLLVFSTIWRYPARVKCATLAWHAMLGAVDKKQKVSTETEGE